jgi:formiminotetrahydrofolate cyclodeaminase
MKYKDMTYNAFMDILSSKAPVPGGGGASALVGSVGMALGSMVGNLTLGKKKYAAVEADIMLLLDKAEQIRQELLLLMDKMI